MSSEQTVEVKCRECEKRGRVGVSFQYLTDSKPGCNRGLKERMALRCPASRCTPSWRMLPTVIGSPGGCFCLAMASFLA